VAPYLAGMWVYVTAVAATIYVVFLATRALVAKLAGVRGRLGPFGEAPLDQLARAPVAARLALALIGPAAIYGLVVTLLALALHSGGEIKEGSTLVDPMPSGPAAEAGVQDGDRIRAVAGRPIAAFEEIRPLIARHLGEPVDVIVERDGRPLRIPVTVGAIGSAWEGRLGVERRREPVALGEAFRIALPRPLEMLAMRLQPRPRIAELTGPVGITLSVAAAGQPPLSERFSRMAALAGVGALDGYMLLAFFLFPYRRRQTAAPSVPSPAPPHPWLRLLARVVDLAVFVLVLAVPAVAINPGLPDAAGNSLALLTIPIEAALLATWGTTPGKALLGVRVRDAGGGKLSFGAALRRAAAVWTFGLMANTIILVTGLMSWHRLRRHGATYWDALDNHRVDHDDPPGWRISVAIGIVLVVVAYMVAVEAKSLTREL